MTRDPIRQDFPRLSARLSAVLTILLSAASAGANETIEDRLRKLNIRHRTDHYVLAGTISDQQFRQYGQALEYMYREYEKGFRELLSLEAEEGDGIENAAEDSIVGGGDKRFRVIIFARQTEYDEFSRLILNSTAESTRGQYWHRYRLLLIRADGATDDVISILFHEAFHQFLRRYVDDPPMWLNEGLATYFGTARPAGQGVRIARPNRNYWKMVRTQITARRPLDLAEVVYAHRAVFYDMTPVKVSGFEGVTRRSLFYAHAYTLIHMMMNDGQGRKRLADYIRALAVDKGRNTTTITEEYFSREFLRDLGPHWVKYVRSNPEN